MSKTDLELTEIAARWLGYEQGLTLFTFVDNKLNNWVGIKDVNDEWVKFNPLHDRNDLDKVVVRLMGQKDIIFHIRAGAFVIYTAGHDEKLLAEGNYPADFPRAILELVAEIAKENKP